MNSSISDLFFIFIALCLTIYNGLKKMKSKFLMALAGVVAIAMICGCMSNDKGKTSLVVFHAGSLSVPFGEIEKEFEKTHPEVDVQREARGSVESIRRITDLGREADVLGSADYTLIEEMMFPEHASWYAAFAKNQMVVVYTDKSRYAGELNKGNWYEILTREDVEVGHSDPNTDPCGYRTLLVWQLAEKHYGKPSLCEKLGGNAPEKNIRPTETDLMALLDAGELDYVFIYISIATQHGYRFIELPPEIDLGDVRYADFYRTVNVTLSDGVIQEGKPIVYGVTIPENPPNRELAVDFVEFLLSDKGQRIMEESGQLSLSPAITNDKSKVPEEIKDRVVEWRNTSLP